MDELISLFKQIFAQYGILGVIVLYFAWDKYQDWKDERKEELELKRKKESGEYVSFSDVRELKEKVGMLTRHFSELQKKVGEHIEKFEEHIEKEAKEDIMFEGVRKDVQYLDENQKKADDKIEKIFSLISNVKDKMIEMGYGQKGA